MNKFIMLVMGVMLLAWGLFACDHHTQAQKEKEYLHYYQDQRTGLCFAGNCLDCDHPTLTNVPCTPEVEKLVESMPDWY